MFIAMKKLLVALFVYCSAHSISMAQIMPLEGSKLNYRLIGFEFPQVKTAKANKVQIASGNITNQADFEQHIVNTVAVVGNKVVAEVPAFGEQYTWRVLSDDKAAGELHHFTTLFARGIDTAQYRLHVTKNEGAFSGNYTFLDANRVLYDMNGKPVWFLPDLPGVSEDLSGVRDLKVTSRGTITFLSNIYGYEVNYNGEVLWKTPNNGKVSGDTSEYYHHEFTRLENGHYMVLGAEKVTWKVPAEDFGKSMMVFGADGKPMPGTVTNEKLEFGTVIEYDAKGNVVWSWKSSKYFKDTYNQPDRQKKDVLQSHENAFSFDEKSKDLYVSFKNLGRILKVKYPSGQVVNSFGKVYDPESKTLSSKVFCEQHGVKVSPSGVVYLFNNNLCNVGATPSVLMFKEKPGAKGQMDVVWDYSYPYDDASSLRMPLTQGGNVVELPGKNMFVSMCNPFNNVFIVSHEKQVLWDAILERWNNTSKKWDSVPLYRASIIKSRAEIEKLIWNVKVGK